MLGGLLLLDYVGSLLVVEVRVLSGLGGMGGVVLVAIIIGLLMVLSGWRVEVGRPNGRQIH